MHLELVEYAGVPFWKAVEPRGPAVGSSGPTYRYAVYIQKGSRLWRERVVRRIDATLADPRGWTRGAVRFQRVSLDDADTDVLVALPDTVDALCAPLSTLGEVSCCQGRKVVINVRRWREAVPHWPGSITSYRQMLINHEFGHRIGLGHRYCGGAGQQAPVMQQQTYGLQGCRATSWPLEYELPR